MDVIAVAAAGLAVGSLVVGVDLAVVVWCFEIARIVADPVCVEGGIETAGFVAGFGVGGRHNRNAE